MINPARDHLRAILADVGVAQSVYDGWACNQSHNTLEPKQCLDTLLEKWARFERLDHLHDSQPLTSHAEKLVGCRELFASHVEPNGPWGDHTISEAGKQAIITRVKGCLSQQRAVIASLLGTLGIN